MKCDRVKCHWQMEGECLWPDDDVPPTHISSVQSTSWLAAVQDLRDECEASSRLIPPAFDRDGAARRAFKTVAERLDQIIAANAHLRGER